MTAGTATRTPVASWWAHGCDRWLEVVAETRRGVADGWTARDHIGPASWEHNGRVYLAEQDAYSWLAATGLVEQDVHTRYMGRAPSGFRSVRDARVAAAADGVDDGVYWEVREAECYPPDVESPPPPVRPVDDDGVCRVGKAERRARNRRLAAEVRACGLQPNGDVWTVAKRLHNAGHRVTLETLTLAGVTV